MATEKTKRLCRYCGAPLSRSVVDLGLSPLCQTHIHPADLNKPEVFYPLHVLACDECRLVQLDQYVTAAEIFEEYAYFSSYSDSWVEHAKDYVKFAMQRFDLGSESLVMEIACNDGYLLQHFVAEGVPVVGVEPAANVGEVARSKGIAVETCFFSRNTCGKLIRQHGQPDLLVGNNVLAHVPDLNDFVSALAMALKRGGTITMEFPHLLRLLESNQFDTIYHEHFSYFSLKAVSNIFAGHGLQVFDVQELATHGGSLRIFAQALDSGAQRVSANITDLIEREEAAGLLDGSLFVAFADRVAGTKRRLLQFLISQKDAGKHIAGYGAPGKGNTLLNYCGIRTDLVDYTVDRNPYKQGKYTPGTRIPILDPSTIAETQPDYLLILPWNLKEEIIAATAYIRDWGGQWIIPIPELEVLG